MAPPGGLRGARARRHAEGGCRCALLRCVPPAARRPGRALRSPGGCMEAHVPGNRRGGGRALALAACRAAHRHVLCHVVDLLVTSGRCRRLHGGCRLVLRDLLVDLRHERLQRVVFIIVALASALQASGSSGRDSGTPAASRPGRARPTGPGGGRAPLRPAAWHPASNQPAASLRGSRGQRLRAALQPALTGAGAAGAASAAVPASAGLAAGPVLTSVSEARSTCGGSSAMGSRPC